MELPKKYFHDKPVLALASANIFLAILVTVSVLLRLSGNTGEGYILQYRENLGLNPFVSGSAFEMVSFIIFAIAVLAISTAMSLRVYELKRQLSLTVLGFSILIMVLTLIVSNALLVLQ